MAAAFHFISKQFDEHVMALNHQIQSQSDWNDPPIPQIFLGERVSVENEEPAGQARAVGSLVGRALDSRPEGLGSMPDATKYPPSTHGFPCRHCGGGDRWCRHLSSLWGISPSLSPEWCSRPTTGVHLAPCHDEFHGPRSD
ncbi:hypothetical protein TNCV_5039991 [Trichonephila clavipes]|nr:hypothetical protein TNCV_5039991 [Trichonephila clavipes]